MNLYLVDLGENVPILVINKKPDSGLCTKTQGWIWTTFQGEYWFVNMYHFPRWVNTTLRGDFISIFGVNLYQFPGWKCIYFRGESNKFQWLQVRIKQFQVWTKSTAQGQIWTSLRDGFKDWVVCLSYTSSTISPVRGTWTIYIIL